MIVCIAVLGYIRTANNSKLTAAPIFRNGVEANVTALDSTAPHELANLSLHLVRAFVVPSVTAQDGTAVFGILVWVAEPVSWSQYAPGQIGRTEAGRVLYIDQVVSFWSPSPRTCLFQLVSARLLYLDGALVQCKESLPNVVEFLDLLVAGLDRAGTRHSMTHTVCDLVLLYGL